MYKRQDFYIGMIDRDIVEFCQRNAIEFVGNGKSAFATMMSALRASHGAASPFDVMPAVWITSVCGLCAGVLMAKLLGKRRRP